LAAFFTHARLWVIPTLVTMAGSLLYAIVKPATWRASQAMEVRNEAIGNQHGRDQFGSIDEMKVYQETILEVARSRVVAEAVLATVGPPPTRRSDQPWPTDEDIRSLQSSISITPPKGAEWGRTKILYLAVTGQTPPDALQRTRAVCDELERHLGELRNANAQSVIVELERAEALAQADLDDATTKLEALEREVGEDLGELRLLTEMGSGDSNLRSTLNQVKQELRQAESARESLRQLKELLEYSLSDTAELLATPSRLLDAQPSLRSLKEKLTDAQTDLSKLRGVMSALHPKVQAAARTEKQIRIQLQAETRIAMRGIEADLAANASQIRTLTEQFTEVQNRLDRLANLRARYGNLVADTRLRTQTLHSVKQKLADAKAVQNAASLSSLLTRFGPPTVGDRPVGPSKRITVVAGAASGLALGAGLVFLFMPIGPNGTKRRWDDYVNVGRRATDQIFGRRASDVTGRSNPGRVQPAVARRSDDRAARLPQQNAASSRRATDQPAVAPGRPAGEPNNSSLERRGAGNQKTTTPDQRITTGQA
jgi:uncharacterized protein involved in exopolysaccharide biosynthesis